MAKFANHQAKSHQKTKQQFPSARMKNTNHQNNQNLNKSSFKYNNGVFEVKKTIRFQAVPVTENISDFRPSQNQDSKHTFTNLQIGLEKILEKFEGLFFDGGQTKLNKKFKIKYNWLRVYTKNEFYNFSKKYIKKVNQKLRQKRKKEKDIKDFKSYEFSEVPYLQNDLERWENEWQKNIDRIKYLLSQSKESQKRRREFALVLRNSSKRQNFEFVEEFVKSIENTNKPYLDKEILDFKQLISDTKDILISLTNQYLPSQSNGLEVARASFNYYTLNKDPKQYSDQILNKENQLKNSYDFENHRDLDLLINLGFSEIEEYTNERGKPDKRIKKIFNKDEVKNLSIDYLYKHLKDWKAYQKSKFNEEIANFLSKYEETYSENLDKALEIQNKYPIFATHNQQEFESYLSHSWQILKLGIQKNDILQELGLIGKELERQISDKEYKNKN